MNPGDIYRNTHPRAKHLALIIYVHDRLRVVRYIINGLSRVKNIEDFQKHFTYEGRIDW